LVHRFADDAQLNKQWARIHIDFAAARKVNRVWHPCRLPDAMRYASFLVGGRRRRRQPTTTCRSNIAHD